MKKRAEEYLLYAEKYLAEGDEEIKEGNIKQGGEKYWGASASIIKAWAEEKGIQHNGHAWLFEAVEKLSEEVKNPHLRKQFSLASTLHINFYEGWLTKKEVEENSLEAKKFCEKVKEVLIKNGKKNEDENE
jgi:hypothetical protein